MKNRTASTLTALVLAAVTIFATAIGGNAEITNIEGADGDANISISIRADVINNKAIDDNLIGLEVGDGSIDIVEGDIESNIIGKEIARGINSIDKIDDIAIADRIARIDGINEINLIDGVEINGISRNI
jgi:hypothetical protein